MSQVRISLSSPPPPETKEDSVAKAFYNFYAKPLKNILENYLHDEKSAQTKIIYTRLSYLSEKDKSEVGSWIKTTFKAHLNDEGDVLLPRQLTLLGLAYFYGLGVKTDFDKAKAYFTSSNDPFAKAMLGKLLCTYLPYNTTKDFQTGKDVLRNALVEGEYLTEVIQGDIYHSKGLLDKAKEHYTTGAYHEIAEAGYKLGKMLEIQHEQEKHQEYSPRYQSYDEFLHMYEEAAKLGCVPALIAMALCYEQGTFVQKNDKRAALYFQLAAKRDLQAKAHYDQFYKPESSSFSGLFRDNSHSVLLQHNNQNNDCLEKFKTCCTIL